MENIVFYKCSRCGRVHIRIQSDLLRSDYCKDCGAPLIWLKDLKIGKRG